MRLQVLLSCMHQDDRSIISRSNLSGVSTLVVNQCNTDSGSIETDGIHTILNTATRGLSVSRNLAIEHASAEICMLSDDDESFIDGFDTKIIKAYESLPDADIIAFKISNFPNKLGDKIKRLKRLDLLKVSSCQISMRLDSVRGKVAFDTNLGAGTQNGAGEENKFLLDAHKAGLVIYYVPVDVATLNLSESTWFSGYNKEFFFNRGKTTRYILGFWTALLYGMHFIVTKYKRYKGDISPISAFFTLVSGIFTGDINKKYKQTKKG